MKRKATAINIIKKDCHVQWQYIDGDGKTCAIGALALASGIGKRMLQKAESEIITPEPGHTSGKVATMRRISSAIRRVFGLTAHQQREIQNINDEPRRNTRSRRSAIIKFLNTL